VHHRILATAVVCVVVSCGATAQTVEPLTLRQAIGEALAASPALRAPDDGRTMASIRERQAASRFGLKVTPTFQTGSDPAGVNQRTLGVGVSKWLPSGTAVQFNADTFQFGEGAGAWRDAGYTFGVSQPLLRGWTAVASADRDQARRSLQSADRTYADARQRLVVTVADAYFAVVRAGRLADAADRVLERARHLRTASEARSKVGLATELDVLRADLLASQSEAAVVAQREQLDTAVEALKTLIGRPADGSIALPAMEAAEIDALGGEATGPVEHYVTTALANRLEVREARDRIGDARRAQTVAHWNLLPPVNLDVAYTRRGLGNGFSAPFDQLVNGWRFGISSQYALDRSDEAAQAAAAAVSVRAAQREAEDTERRVADEVRRAHRAWARTGATVDIQSKAVAMAERQLRLSQIRYERGVAGNFDVVDAENNLFQAQSGLIAAQVERALAGLALRRAAGVIRPEEFTP
jgi:outer membrane protein TolC